MMRFGGLSAILLSFVVGQAAVADDAAKAPVPDASAQAAAMTLVAEVYKNEISQVRKPEEKSALAKKILQTGIETNNDPAGKFALLTEAKNLAIEAMDPTTALAAVDETAKSFQIDALPAKVEALTKLAKAAHLPADYKALTAAINPLIDQAIAADDYDAATQFTDLAWGSARRSEDSALSNQLSTRLLEIASYKAAFARAEQALVTLNANPKDPDANLTVGKFLCFVKGDWDRGLPMLAMGSDATLKGLAESELANPTDTQKQVALGDGWWAAADKEKGAGKKQLLLRADKWYRQALPQLAGGLAKAKVERRIQEIEASAKPPAPEAKANTVDLLKLIDPTKDTVAGVWKIAPEGLTSDQARTGVLQHRLRIPYSPPEEYDFHIEFIILTGNDSVLQIMTHAGHEFAWNMGGWNNSASGFEMIGNLGGDRNNTTVKAAAVFELHTRYDCVVKVRRDSLSAYINGKLVSGFKTNFSDLSIWDGWSVGQNSLGIGSYDHVVFHVIEIIEVTGHGKALPR